MWEAVSENLLAPGETALIPATGHFSEQWALTALFAALRDIEP
ncbi:MAG: hypothetical protein ACM3SO_02675 [Betaproteobacteria bacterium]